MHGRLDFSIFGKTKLLTSPSEEASEMAKMKPSFLLLPVAAIFIFLNACTALFPIQFSRPGLSHADIEISKNGVISMDGLDLKVVPQNEHIPFGLVGYIIPIIPWPFSSSSLNPPQFEIQVVLDPQGDAFTLDPGRIALNLPDMPAISPVGFRRGPGAFSDEKVKALLVLGAPPSEDVSCEVDSKADHVPIPVAPITLSDRTCFVLVFPTPPPSPNQQFTLAIDGILRAGQPFPIPPIHFKKGRTLLFGWGIPI
jgi:hypothetical protein